MEARLESYSSTLFVDVGDFLDLDMKGSQVTIRV